MDTENFIVKRQDLVRRMEERRAKDLSQYPFQTAENFGLKLPSLAKLALTLFSGGGMMNKVLEIGVPLAMPFLFKRQRATPSWAGLLQRLFTSKA